MNPPTNVESPSLAYGNREALREIWAFLVGMGRALMFLGLVAISLSFIAALATVIVFGVLLLLGALFQVITAFCGRSWRGFALHLLSGVLYLLVGVFMIDHPVEAALSLTLLVALGLLAKGIVRMAMSVVERFDGWGLDAAERDHFIRVRRSHLAAMAFFWHVVYRVVRGDRNAVEWSLVADRRTSGTHHAESDATYLKTNSYGALCGFGEALAQIRTALEQLEDNFQASVHNRHWISRLVRFLRCDPHDHDRA